VKSGDGSSGINYRTHCFYQRIIWSSRVITRLRNDFTLVQSCRLNPLFGEGTELKYAVQTTSLNQHGRGD